jgi:ribosomal protein S18 acetylase RimI-like enzyme
MQKKKIDFKNFKKKTLRSLFVYLEKDTKKDKLSENHREILDSGMKYIQMKLPVEKITPEFENFLKNKIDDKIFNAHIREATPKDLESVKNIYNKSWLTSNTPFRPIEKSMLKKIFDDEDTVFLIAKVYNIDCGFVILDLEGKEKEFGVIAGLGVLPRFQGKGLGTILGLAAWDHLKKKGLKELRCEVYKNNIISYKFIKGLNFEEFGEKIYRKEDFELLA